MTATHTRAALAPTATTSSTISPALLSRSCSCGRHPVAGGRCESCRTQPTEAPTVQRSARPAAANGAGMSVGDFSRIPAFSASGVVPSGRTAAVSMPGDPHEREAEAVADAVMQHRSPPPQAAAPAAETARQAAASDEPALTVDEERREPTSAGSGNGLPAETRAWFEERMGHDLGGVQVHHDGDAAQMADELHADAFTRGDHIYFARGRYDPHSDSGRRLLAHELTHTVQQRGGAPGARERIDRRPSAAVDDRPAQAGLLREDLPQEPDDLMPRRQADSATAAAATRTTPAEGPVPGLPDGPGAEAPEQARTTGQATPASPSATAPSSATAVPQTSLPAPGAAAAVAGGPGARFSPRRQALRATSPRRSTPPAAPQAC